MVMYRYVPLLLSYLLTAHYNSNLIIDQRLDDNLNNNKEVDLALRSEVTELASRNEHLENIITSLQEKNHRNNLQVNQ